MMKRKYQIASHVLTGVAGVAVVVSYRIGALEAIATMAYGFMWGFIMSSAIDEAIADVEY